jgi:hypothetical protein
MKFESSTEKTADLSHGHTHTPKIRHQYDGGDKIGVFFGLFLELVADSNAVFLWSLLSGLGTNCAAMPCMLSSSDKIRWHIPYQSLTMLQTS